MHFLGILLWLFVITLGIASGAGLYEARIVVPIWASAPPASLRSPDSGREFWAFVTTAPLSLLTIGSLIAASRGQGARYQWWLVATIIALADRLATFSYFIPTLLRLQRASASRVEIVARLARWIRLNHVRNALTLLAWMAAMKALSSPAQ
jgi:hypothetical protein